MLDLLIFGLAAVSLQSRDCIDDNGRDRCDPADRARVEALLGLPSIEDEAEAGVESYRVIQIDGYGREMPAIVFERRPGASPRVVVYNQNGVRLIGAVPATDWEAVRREARFADRALEPLPQPEDPPGHPISIRICLHAWVSTVEMANSPLDGGQAAPVRRRTESACNDELTTTFAFGLAARAIRLLPECDVLDPDKHRNDVTRLAACTRLEGDRMAAAALMNQIGEGHVDLRDDLTPEMAWSFWMGVNNQAQLDWAGQRVRNEPGVNSSRVSAFLVRQQAQGRMTLWLNGFRGVSSRRVETVGVFRREVDDRQSRAAFAQIWIWDTGLREWKLESWTVEPFAPAD